MSAPDPGPSHRLLLPPETIGNDDSWMYNVTSGAGPGAWAMTWSPDADSNDVGKTLQAARFVNPGGCDLFYRRAKPVVLCGCGNHDIFEGPDEDPYAQHREWSEENIGEA